MFPRQKIFTREIIKKERSTRCEQRGATPVLESRTRRLVMEQTKTLRPTNVREGIRNARSDNEMCERAFDVEIPKLKKKKMERRVIRGAEEPKGRTPDGVSRDGLKRDFKCEPLFLERYEKLDSRQQVSDVEKKNDLRYQCEHLSNVIFLLKVYRARQHMTHSDIAYTKKEKKKIEAERNIRLP